MIIWETKLFNRCSLAIDRVNDNNSYQSIYAVK